MKRFEKSRRGQTRWKELVRTSYEFGYQEGDYLFAAGYQAALPRRRKIDQALSEEFAARNANPGQQPFLL